MRLFLFLLSVTNVLASEIHAADLPSLESEGELNRAMWQGWSLGLEGGLNFKALTDADFSQVRTGVGHDTRFWGESGINGALGFKYSRVFMGRGYWGIKAMWTFFYPDIRWQGESAKITLSSIPFIGNYINLGTLPGYWTMILIPVLYFDVGYITKKGYLFSLGSVYLWGLSPAFTIPFDNHWSLEFRSTIFLDRLIFNSGYHNLFTSVGLNYKF